MSLADEIINGTTYSVAKYLAHRPSEINEIDKYGFTPLIESAIVDNIDIAKLLIEHGADINQQDATGGTALHWTVENNNLEFCELLLKHKADPNASNISSQPVLAKALLRQQQPLKQLLYKHGADLKFAQDFINTKLLGHRFELRGYVDIVDHLGRFVEINFEGFFLEFTLGIIRHSLVEFRHNFAAKHLRKHFDRLQHIIDALTVAEKLIQYQQYRVDISKFQQEINHLLRFDLLLIPVAFEGHAITFIKYHDLLAKCDRGEASKTNDSVAFFHVNNPYALTSDFIKNLIYKKQSSNFINMQLPQQLALSQLTQLLVESQISGNCSWANVEACVPAMMFLLMLNEQHDLDRLVKHKMAAMSLYNQWREWDKDRALHQCIISMKDASKQRRHSKAHILGAILFQRCDYTVAKDVERAKRILAILMLTEYQYVIDSYLRVYYRKQRTEAGENLVQLLKICGYQ